MYSRKKGKEKVPDGIDPTSMNEEDAALVSAFLQQELKKTPKRKRFNADEELTFVDADGRKRSFMLSKTLIYRSKINLITRQKESRYSVLGKRIGKGTSGEVFQIDGTLSFKNDGMVYDQRKNRILKIQTHLRGNRPTHNYLLGARREAKLVRRIPELHGKKLTIERRKKGKKKTKDELGAESFMVMENKGAVLDQFLKSNDVPLKEKLQIAINVLRAYQEQIEDNGLIHRDIKTKNILINPETYEIYFIDLGFTLQEGELPEYQSGTPAYSAPEVLLDRKNIDYRKADYYSLGLVLSEVLGADHTKDLIGLKEERAEGELDKYILRARKMLKRKRTHEFLGLLASEEIRTALKVITHYEPNRRHTSDEVLAKFEDELFHLQHAKLRVDDYEKRKSAHQEALAARDKLREIKREGLYRANKIKKTNTPHDNQSFPNPLVEMKKVLEESSKNIDETNIAEFIKALGVKAFEGSKDREGILAKTEEIFAEFTERTDTLFRQIDEMETILVLLEFVNEPERNQRRAELRDLLNRAEYILNKGRNSEVTIDDIVALNKRMERAMEKANFSPILNNFLDSQAARQTTQPYKKMNEYHELYKRTEKDISDIDEPITHLKNDLKTAIRAYLHNTLTHQNMRKGKRAASLDRYNQMYEILDIIDQHHSDNTQELIDAVKGKLKGTRFSKIDLGLFSVGSELRGNIMNAIDRFEKQPVNSMIDRIRREE